MGHGGNTLFSPAVDALYLLVNTLGSNNVSASDKALFSINFCCVLLSHTLICPSGLSPASPTAPRLTLGLVPQKVPVGAAATRRGRETSNGTLGPPGTRIHRSSATSLTEVSVPVLQK